MKTSREFEMEEQLLAYRSGYPSGIPLHQKASRHALDRRTVAQDQPDLRSLADSLRLVCLPLPWHAAHFDDHRSGAKALL